MACRTTPGRPLHKYAVVDTEDEERVCRSCPLVATKPERIPEHVLPFVAIAVELEQVQAAGGRFDYPGALTIYEWACLIAVHRGRERAAELKRKRERRSTKRQR